MLPEALPDTYLAAIDTTELVDLAKVRGARGPRAAHAIAYGALLAELEGRAAS